MTTAMGGGGGGDDGGGGGGDGGGGGGGRGSSKLRGLAGPTRVLRQSPLMQRPSIWELIENPIFQLAQQYLPRL